MQVVGLAMEGRASLVLRIEGTDRGAPTLALMGHTDVVPADPEGWERDPFGGELADGEIWGRGAIDMLGITASMAVAVKRLLRAGWRPRASPASARPHPRACPRRRRSSSSGSAPR